MLPLEGVHALVLVLPCVIACVVADQPLLWLRCFAELSAVLVAGILTAAGIAEALYAALGRPLQPQKAPSSKLRLWEALESARAMVVFSTFAAWPRYLLVLGRPTAFVWSLAEAQPEAPTSLLLYAVKLVAVTLLVDFYMYSKHRLLHTRALHRFHRGHHAFHNPTPFASFAVAPVEAALTFCPVLLLCLPQAPIWAHAYGAWTGAFVALNLYLHAGYELAPFETMLRLVGLNSSAFHNVHHSCGGSRNFGELMYVWDSLLGTGRHPEAQPLKQQGSEGRAAKED